jgi:hypothetical protein
MVADRLSLIAYRRTRIAAWVRSFANVLRTIFDKRYAISVLLVLGTAACRQDMHDQPKDKAFSPSRFFDDGRGSRPLVAGVVARGHLDDDEHLYTGKIGSDFVPTFPFPVTADVLARGRERFDIFCAPCHDRTGSGDGMIVRRGYRRPPSFHIDRLRGAAPGYWFDVITRGFGVMPDYAAQIPVHDRWAIVAYVRGLQLSQHATMAEVPPAEQSSLASRSEDHP